MNLNDVCCEPSGSEPLAVCMLPLDHSEPHDFTPMADALKRVRLVPLEWPIQVQEH